MEWNDSPLEGDKQINLIQNLTDKFSFINKFQNINVIFLLIFII